MKLYATIQSERASKGQGGNKQLHITILREVNGERVPTYFIGVWPNELVVEHIPSQKEVYRETVNGKKCAECGEDMFTLVRAHHHTEMIDGYEQDVTTKAKKQKGKNTCEHLERILTNEPNGTWGYKCSSCQKYQ